MSLKTVYIPTVIHKDMADNCATPFEILELCKNPEEAKELCHKWYETECEDEGLECNEDEGFIKWEDNGYILLGEDSQAYGYNFYILRKKIYFSEE